MPPDSIAPVAIVRCGVPAEVHRRLSHLAVDLGMPRAELVARILSHHVGVGDPPPKPTPDPERAYGNTGPTDPSEAA